MLTEISPYSEPVSACILIRGDDAGYRLALNKWFWCSAQAEAWLGQDVSYPCGARWVLSVDVLPPVARPTEYSRPVFLAEARAGFFFKYRVFGKGELLRFLFRCCFEGGKYLTGSPRDNILLLSEQKIAVVHWLPGYNCWQLHVTDDWPYQVGPNTRIFALQ